MRIKRLDLTRYGKFTNQSIEFGNKIDGAPDLHIIYGPNEAGKSTALSAYLDFLFGIEGRTNFDFLHPKPTMRVGGILELSGKERELIRVKKQSGSSLLDNKEQVISEGIITSELGGLNRESYRSMFSLDDDTLEAGGENILASKGDLGQLLFSASAGLSDISNALSILREKSDEFFKPGGRKHKLAVLKSDIDDLKSEREKIDTFASHYSKLLADRDRTKAQYDTALSARTEMQSLIDGIQCKIIAIPRSVELKSLRNELSTLVTLRPAPVAWITDLPDLHKAEIELSTKRNNALEDQEALKQIIESSINDVSVLALVDRIDRLTELRSRYQTAKTDLPNRELSLRENESKISLILKAIDQIGKDADSLLLPTAIVANLRKMLADKSGILIAFENASEELENAEQSLADTHAEIGVAINENNQKEMQLLVSVLEGVLSDDYVARRRLAQNLIEEHQDNLADGMKALEPWNGTVDDLQALSMPTNHNVETWKRAFVQGELQVEKILENQEDLRAECVRLKNIETASRSIIGIVNDQEAVEVRARREANWAVHKQKLDVISAEEFESALRMDDTIVGARIKNTQEVEKLNQAIIQLVQKESEILRINDQLEKAQNKIELTKNEVLAAVESIGFGLSKETSVEKLEEWTRLREKALAYRSELMKANRELKSAEQDGEAARKKLSSSLASAGIEYKSTDDLDTLITLAKVAIDNDGKMQGLRSRLEENTRAVKTRKQKFEKETEAYNSWKNAWNISCSECWLATVPLSLEAIEETLSRLSELEILVISQRGLSDRVQKMRSDQAEFVDEVNLIAQELKVSSAQTDLILICDEIIARLKNAQLIEASNKEKSSQLDQISKKLNDIDEEIEIVAARKLEMTEFFEVFSFPEIEQSLRKLSKKLEIESRISNIENELLENLKCSTLVEVENVLSDINRHDLESELIKNKVLLEDEDARRLSTFAAYTSAEDKLESVGGDDAVAAIEEKRRTILLEIEDRSQDYLQTKMGIVAAELALRIYRDKHRSSMMAKASDAFSTISRGNYISLTTQPNGDSETLIGVSSNGGSKLSQEMSKGTRFQLYLALRVAGYYEFLKSSSPVPFIADDIMETFDDGRAGEAFQLFAEMSQVGQVIYFTHHQHLCEIAKRNCPGIKIHNLETVIQGDSVRISKQA